MNILFSLVLIAVGSIGSFLLGTRRGRRYYRSLSMSTTYENGLYDPAGKTAIVVEPITSKLRGRVRYQGTTWPAKSFDRSFHAGDQVVISRLDNITMIVAEPHRQGSRGESGPLIQEI